MTRVRKFVPENKLAKTLEDPNGLLFSQALQNACMNMDKVRDPHMKALEAKLDLLSEQAASATATGDPEAAAKLYQLAREIYADAGAFRIKHISRAAHSLCELMAGAGSRKQLWAGVAVHVDAIAALRKHPNASAREAILSGLETISKPAT